jgi:hypothetical protein
MRTVSTLHATAAAFEIRLRLPQSFHEKYRQFVGTSPTKKGAPQGAFSWFLIRGIRRKF